MALRLGELGEGGCEADAPVSVGTVQGAATEGLDFLLDRYCRLGHREMPSGAAIDLLRGLLTVDPARRLTIEQVTEHLPFSRCICTRVKSHPILSIVEEAPTDFWRVVLRSQVSRHPWMLAHAEHIDVRQAPPHQPPQHTGGKVVT